MFVRKKKFIALVLLFSVCSLFSVPLPSAERTAKTYAMCITGTPFENCFFLQLFLIEARGNAPWLTSPGSIPLNRQTLAPALNKNQYRITARRFLLQTDRLYQVVSFEPDSPDSPVFSFRGMLKKRPGPAFDLTYQYEENHAETCLKLTGSLQLEPDKIWIAGASVREEKKAETPESLPRPPGK